MKNYRIVIIVFAFFSFVTCDISAQDSLSPLKLKEKSQFQKIDISECDIQQYSSPVLRNMIITNYNDTSFIVKRNQFTKQILLKDVKIITFNRGGGFWTGALIGWGVTTALFTLIGLLSDLDNNNSEWSPGYSIGFIIGAAIGIPVGLITGAIVEAAREDKVYNFDTPNMSARQKRLFYMLEKEKNK